MKRVIKPLSLGKRLQLARWKAKLTQEQVAEKCGIPQSMLSAIENNWIHNPNIATLSKLAKV